MRTQRKFLTWIMVLILSVSMIPTAALAGEPEDENGKVPPICAGYEADESCPAEAHVEGCPLYKAPKAPEDTVNDDNELTAALSDQAEPQDDPAPTDNTMSGTCGATDNEGNVTWALTQNNTDSDSPTYTLTISGSGAMKDFSYTMSSDDRPWAWAKDKITNVNIEENIENIGAYAFRGHAILTNVTFPKSLETIGQQAFRDCNKLSNVNLTDLTNLTEIGVQAFRGVGIDKVDLSKTKLTEIPESAFIYAAMSYVELPTSVKSIGLSAFKNCTSLKRVALSSSLEEISTSAFNMCTSLETVDFTGLTKLNTIGAQAFFSTKLESVDLSSCESLTEFNSYSFGVDNNGSVKSIVLPDKISTVITSGGGISNILTAICYVDGNAECSTLKALASATIGLTNIIPYRACLNGGTFAADTEFEAGKLETPSKEGYIFDGWYSDADFTDTNKVTDDTTLQAGTTYYAKWEECTHTTWNPATCTEPKTCAVCGMTDGGALGHSFTNYVYNNDATYDADGTKTAACDRGCGATDTVTAEGTQLIRASSGSGSGSSGYTVSVDSAKHGSVTVSPKSAKKGDTVTVTVKPDKGYELDDLTVTDKDGDELKLAKKSDTKYTFTMPASKVEVEATFVKIEEAPQQTFTDVPDGYWAGDAIAWASENGCMNGTTTETFNPEGTVSRQQLWMILARLSGYNPAAMAEAKSWAVDNGISDGTAPGGAVSRQQLVTILYRYAQRMGYQTDRSADLTAYPDHTGVAAYAKDAMSWSVANSIVGGTTQGTLNPSGTATRAQFAVILQRFVEHVM